MSLMSASRVFTRRKRWLCANFTCSPVRLPPLLSERILGEDERGVERRAQLVAHVGEENSLLYWLVRSSSSAFSANTCCEAGEGRRVCGLEDLRLLLELANSSVSSSVCCAFEPGLRFLERAALHFQLLVRERGSSSC